MNTILHEFQTAADTFSRVFHGAKSNLSHSGSHEIIRPHKMNRFYRIAILFDSTFSSPDMDQQTISKEHMFLQTLEQVQTENPQLNINWIQECLHALEFEKIYIVSDKFFHSDRFIPQWKAIFESWKVQGHAFVYFNGSLVEKHKTMLFELFSSWPMNFFWCVFESLPKWIWDFFPFEHRFGKHDEKKTLTRTCLSIKTMDRKQPINPHMFAFGLRQRLKLYEKSQVLLRSFAKIAKQNRYRINLQTCWELLHSELKHQSDISRLLFFTTCVQKNNAIFFAFG